MKDTGLVLWVLTQALDIQTGTLIVRVAPRKTDRKEKDMTQVQVQEKQQQAETLQQQPQEPALCDACGVRAVIGCFMPFGTLYFCNHHYNKHAMALESQGATISELSLKTGNE
jgi:hypothetical protein